MLLCLAYTARGEEIEKDTAKIRNVELSEVFVQSFKQFSTLIPNLFMPDYGSKLTSPVYIRGIGSKINAPSVGLYVDGIPYFEKSAFAFDFNRWTGSKCCAVRRGRSTAVTRWAASSTYKIASEI